MKREKAIATMETLVRTRAEMHNAQLDDGAKEALRYLVVDLQNIVREIYDGHESQLREIVTHLEKIIEIGREYAT